MILQVECLELEGLQMEKCHIALFLSDLRRCALLPRKSSPVLGHILLPAAQTVTGLALSARKAVAMPMSLTPTIDGCALRFLPRAWFCSGFVFVFVSFLFCRLDREEQNVVLSVLLLAQILDGASMSEHRLELWERIRIAVADGNDDSTAPTSTAAAAVATAAATAPSQGSAGSSGGESVSRRRMPEEELEGVGAAFRHRQLISAQMIEMAIEGSGQVAYAETRLGRLWYRVQKLLLMS
jgi:hypothetical protein